MECSDDKKGGQLVKLRRRRLFELRDIFLFLMLHLNEDSDDDLLLDALSLLSAIEVEE